MTTDEVRDRFRHLPEPVRPEDAVESVDVGERRLTEESDERERFLRGAGGV
jgi:hypothetical protein